MWGMLLILGAPESWDSHACASEVRGTQVREHIGTGWPDRRRACKNSWLRHGTTTAPQSAGVCIPPGQEHSLLAALILDT